MTSRGILLLLIILIIPVAATARDGNKVEQTGAFADQSASESVRKALDQKGYKVVLADGSTLCEIWLRSALPAGKEASGASYTGIGESSLVGVISFPKATTDFRGQQVKPGSYTLRYALYPPDGNHMGISPIRDFLLMIPVSIDQTADQQYKFEELTKMSAKTTGTTHPAVVLLVLPEGKTGPAAVTQNEHGHLVFSAPIKTASGANASISFVVKGVAEQ